jgi:hypothetical protein
LTTYANANQDCRSAPMKAGEVGAVLGLTFENKSRRKNKRRRVPALAGDLLCVV